MKKKDEPHHTYEKQEPLCRFDAYQTGPSKELGLEFHTVSIEHGLETRDRTSLLLARGIW